MTFTLEAPSPNFQTTSFLPDPLLGDSVGATGTIQEPKRSMNGTTYIYVKSRTRKRLVWNFRISQEKALELQAFFNSYNSSVIRIRDHLGNIYLGNFITNPFEFEATGRSVASPGLDTIDQVQLQFEGEEQ